MPRPINVLHSAASLNPGTLSEQVQPSYARLSSDQYRQMIAKFREALSMPKRPPGEPVFQYDRTPGELENLTRIAAHVVSSPCTR